MQVAKMMLRELTTVAAQCEFSDLLLKQACLPSRQIYVTDPAAKLLGIITSYDLLKLMAPFYLDSNLARALPDDSEVVAQAFTRNQSKTAAEIMQRKFHALAPSDNFALAEAVMREKGVFALPVLDADGVLLGEISRREVLKYLVFNVLGHDCRGGD